MKSTLFLLILLTVSSLTSAQTVRITGTGKPGIDGEYRLNGTQNGRSRYTKEVRNSVTYVIYCLHEGSSSVWMIEDNQRNTYFGANGDTLEPPLKGWDKGPAGADLNADFQVEIVRKSSALATAPDAHALLTVRLENNQNTARRIVVRGLKQGQEIVRSRLYQPFETYAYQFAAGTELYLLTEQEGEVLMQTKGKQFSGRLLLTLRPEDANKTFQLSAN